MSVTACGDISSRGTTLFMAIAATGPFIEIGAVTVMPDLSPTATTDTCTDPYGVANDGYKEEFKTGEFDGGDASFTVKIRDGDPMQDQLESYFDGDDQAKNAWFRVQLASTSATKRTFKAIVKGNTHAFPPDGGICTLAVTTKVNSKLIKS